MEQDEQDQTSTLRDRVRGLTSKAKQRALTTPDRERVTAAVGGASARLAEQTRETAKRTGSALSTAADKTGTAAKKAEQLEARRQDFAERQRERRAEPSFGVAPAEPPREPREPRQRQEPRQAREPRQQPPADPFFGGGFGMQQPREPQGQRESAEPREEPAPAADPAALFGAGFGMQQPQEPREPAENRDNRRGEARDSRPRDPLFGRF